MALSRLAADNEVRVEELDVDNLNSMHVSRPCAVSSLVELPPLFSNFGENVLCACEQYVIVLSRRTKKVINRLKTASTIQDFALNPLLPTQIVILGDDCFVSVRDFETSATVSSYKLPFSTVRTLRVNKSPSSSFDLILYVIAKKKSVFGLFSFTLSPKDGLSPCSLEQKLPNLPRHHYAVKYPAFVAYFKDDKCTVHARGSFEESLLRKERPTTIELLCGGRDIAVFFCIATHPTSDSTVALGTSRGQVQIFRDIWNDSPPCTILHWHPNPVIAIQFSPEGTSLYSGGLEGVLVKWPLRNVDTASNHEMRRFLPRLNSTVLHIGISKRGDDLAVCLDDNTLRLVNNQFTVTHVHQHFIRWNAHRLIAIDESLNPRNPAGLLCVLRSALCPEPVMIANATPGELQFYSPSTQTHLFNLDVVRHNLPPVEPESKLVNALICTNVIHVDLCGEWLATVEYRNDECMTEHQLKIWQYSQRDAQFCLNTCIDWPHADRITCLRFVLSSSIHGDIPYIVTTGLDGSFKVWSLVEQQRYLRREDEPLTAVTTIQHWTCSRGGTFREQVAHCLGVSDCGLHIAVGFGRFLVLWDLQSHACISDACCCQAALKKVEFGRNCVFSLCNESHVSCFTVDCDTKKLSRLWTIDSDHCDTIVLNPFDKSTLAACGVEMVNFYSKSSPQSIAQVATKFKSRIVSAAFTAPFELYCIDENSDVYLISDASSEELDCLGSTAMDVKFRQHGSALAQILAATRIDDKSARQPSDQSDVATNSRERMQLISPSAQSLPPLRLVAPGFIRSYLKGKAEEPLPTAAMTSSSRGEFVEPMEIDGEETKRMTSAFQMTDDRWKKLESLDIAQI